MTVLTEKQQLREAIVANRRMLSLLDHQIDELQKLDPGMTEVADPDRHQPFSYVVEGTRPAGVLPSYLAAEYAHETLENRAGIVIPVDPFAPASAPIPTGFQNPYYGYIRVQSDAAFVATRLFACAEIFDLGRLGKQGGVLADVATKTVDMQTADAYFGISFRLYDESASRWLLLANKQGQVQQDTAVPSSLFGPLAMSSAGGVEIPTECVFPRNGLIRVETYIQNSFYPSWFDSPNSALSRIYFVFHGYKVFGG